MNKEIDPRYFAHWCNAYNWIITRNYHFERRMKYVIFQEISWFLDGLSFTDEKVSKRQGRTWIREFELIDDIFRTNDWKAYYVADRVLLFNDRRNIFTTTHMDWIKVEYQDEDLILVCEKDLLERTEYYKKHYRFFEYEKYKYLEPDIRKALKGATYGENIPAKRCNI